MLSNTFAAVCSFAAVANAHMLMATPARFTSPAAKLDPITSANFPCQAVSGDTYAGETTDMELGSDQPLEFQGSAVHGGGSCQVSITYDESPTADSTWKVITSIEGGCVARDTPGNLGGSAETPDPYTYNFTIPDNIPSGKAVLAWTWFNKVGNREMYMQCASIELTGTSGDQSNYESLPDMFTANLDDDANTCHTEADTDVQFPDPGLVVQKLNGATDAFAPPTPATACGASGGSSAATPTAAASGGAAATTTAAAGGGGVFATAGGSSPTASTSEAAPVATTGSSSSSSGSSSSGSSSSSSTSGSCSTEGEYACLDGGATYQICAAGEWSAAMAVASGTQCSGTGADFVIAAAATKSRFRKTREERRALRKRGLGAMFDRA